MAEEQIKEISQELDFSNKKHYATQQNSIASMPGGQQTAEPGIIGHKKQNQMQQVQSEYMHKEGAGAIA